MRFNPYDPCVFLHIVQSVWLAQWLALSASFEYLCYEYTAIINMLVLSVRGPSLCVRIWRLQTSDSDVLRRFPRWKRSIIQIYILPCLAIILTMPGGGTTHRCSHPLAIISGWRPSAAHFSGRGWYSLMLAWSRYKPRKTPSPSAGACLNSMLRCCYRDGIASGHGISAVMGRTMHTVWKTADPAQ